jgi:hypothetical protein
MLRINGLDPTYGCNAQEHGVALLQHTLRSSWIGGQGTSPYEQ